MKRFSFLLGAGVGFVLGSMAGSRPYEQVEATIRKVASRSGPTSSTEARERPMSDAEEANGHADDDEGDHQFVEVVSGGVDKDGNVVVDEVVAEVDSEGRVVATDETIVVKTPEGDIVVDETFSVADDEGELQPIEEDVTVLEAGDTEE
jgi:hypothetical protein